MASQASQKKIYVPLWVHTELFFDNLVLVTNIAAQTADRQFGQPYEVTAISMNLGVFGVRARFFGES